MKRCYAIGVVAATAAGMAAIWLLKDQLQPSATARFMRNGKRMFCRCKKKWGID